MAAIVARLTRRRRQREALSEYDYETSKVERRFYLRKLFKSFLSIFQCMYELPPFEKTFHPLQHNKYLMRRRDVMALYYSSQAYYQSCANKHLAAEERKVMMEKLSSPFTCKQFIFETFLIG